MKQRLQKAYEHDTNKRHDIANKVVHNILTEHDFVAIQDEMIHNWHSGLFGKQVQHSAMGSIKAKLRGNFKTHVVERSYPSTQICPSCGCKTKHPLSKREYDCAYCGYHHDSRDIKSAQSILDEAHRQVMSGTDMTIKSLVETESAVLASLDTSDKIPSEKQEAQVL